jgi:hypothetical protein
MDYAEHIFTRHFNDLVHLQSKNDAYSAARTALIIRLWLIDSSSLIHSVNKANTKKRISFEWIVGPSPFHLLDHRLRHVMMHSMYFDGVRAEYARDMRIGTIQDFLSSPLLYWDGKSFSVKEVVKFVANKLGGAHFSNTLIHEGSAERQGLDSAPLDLLGVSMNVVSNVVTHSSIRDLRDAVIMYPKETPVISHWKAPSGKVLYMNGIRSHLKIVCA